jgi:hypothetical protein
MNALMKDAITVAEHVFKPEEANRMEYVIAGETNLMGAGELSSVDKLRGCSKPSTRSATS